MFKKWHKKLFFFALLLWSIEVAAAEEALDRTIWLERSRGTVYELLNKVSKASGMQFIYEQGVVQNDKKTRIASGSYTLRDALLCITGEPEMQMRVIEEYVWLYKSSDRPKTASNKVVEGWVKDRRTREILPSCSVELGVTGIRTVTNQEGRFVLKIPDSLQQEQIKISHIGYHLRKLPVALFTQGTPEVYLDEAVVQLQEAVVRYVSPQKIIRELLDNRTNNYARQSAHLTAFYREGVEYENTFASLTEGVCTIYKSGFGSGGEDQVKLLKMRKIDNRHDPDSVSLKIQAGVGASIILDMGRHLPDFLLPDRDNYYQYRRVGMERIDSMLVHVVAFEQYPHIKEPLYRGLLYIDSDRWALIKAEFEVNPRFVQQVGSAYIVKKSKKVDVQPQKIKYTVSYQLWEGYFWISHVRGDLDFKIKAKRRLFGGTNTVSAYFEMVTCEINTKEAPRFSGNERLPVGTIFSETRFTYDVTFWEHFNTITPEHKITDAVTKLLLTVEER